MAINVRMQAAWPPITVNTQDATSVALARIEQHIRGDSTDTPGVVEGCAGQWSRGFGSVEVSCDIPMLANSVCRSLLYQVGRDLLLYGESLWEIRSAFRKLAFLPARATNIVGGPDPESWRYRLDLPGPSESEQPSLDATDVLHFRINMDPNQPWRGRSPLAIAEKQVRDRLNAYLCRDLIHDYHPIVVYGGRIAGSPQADAQDEQDRQHRSEARQSRGMLQPPEQIRAEKGTLLSPAPSFQGQAVSLATSSDTAVCAAAGVPPGILVSGALGSAGTAMREDWRRFFAGTIGPHVRLIEDELRLKVNPTITLDATGPVREADAASKARAFQSYVGGGMSPAQAAVAAGLMLPQLQEELEDTVPEPPADDEDTPPNLRAVQ